MNKITLTTRGREILSQNTLQGGEVYWVGYFGLAYVPDQSGFSDDQARLIGDSEHGDYIYNLWQGDLVNEGHFIAADSLSKLTLYDRNITSNFRYMYDGELDRNRLVTWVSGQGGSGSAESETTSYVRDGYRVYNGITLGDSHDMNDMQKDSELPCPAPLFYAGGSVSYGNPLDEDVFVNSVVSNDWPMHKDGPAYPMVTPDMRSYGGSWKGGSTSDKWKWIPDAAGKYDTLPSAQTRNPSGTPAADDCLDQFAEFLSVSNFNKEHGHVSAEGYGVGYQESCHNMSMVTRLFPIANYELTATTDPATTDRNISERGSAKSIKYVIRLNLKAAYQGVRTYLDTLEYQKTDTAGVSADELELYTSAKPNSFKFNRIGIYAVRATIRHFYKEGDAANGTDCRATHYQMEISPDAKPELFAVMQVDEVCMSEDGSFGLSDYNTTFVLNLENTPDDTDLCTNPEVYYNLVENEAITWYQNQLIATAGLSEAVTNLGVNMAYLMNRLGDTGSGSACGMGMLGYPSEYGTEYVPLIQRKRYNESNPSVVSTLLINGDNALGYTEIVADTASCGLLVAGPYRTLLDSGINNGAGIGDRVTPVHIGTDGKFKECTPIGLRKNVAELVFDHITGDASVYHVKGAVNNAINHVPVVNHHADVCSILIEAPEISATEEYNYYVVFDCSESVGDPGVDVENAAPRILRAPELDVTSMNIKVGSYDTPSSADPGESRVTDANGNQKYLRIDQAVYPGIVPAPAAGPSVLTSARMYNNTVEYTRHTVWLDGSKTYMVHVVGGMWEIIEY